MEIEHEKQILRALYFLAERARNGTRFGPEEAAVLEAVIVHLSSSESDRRRFGEEKEKSRGIGDPSAPGRA